MERAIMILWGVMNFTIRFASMIICFNCLTKAIVDRNKKWIITSCAGFVFTYATVWLWLIYRI